MKRIFTCFFLIFILCRNAQSQIISCGTTSGSQSLEELSLENARISQQSIAGILNLNETQCFKLFFHIVKFANGTGNSGTAAYTNTLTCQINSYYNSANIYFINTGYDEILSDTYANYTDAQKLALFNTNKKDSVLNIYLLPQDVLPFGAYGGVANGIPGTAAILGHSNFMNTTVSFPHEVGHILGLYHTHHGRGIEIDSSTCPETSSDCATCGDYVCDTPPDPTLDNTNVSNCVYTGGGGFSPDVQNIMSYAPHSCRTHFTQGQFTRMDGIISGNAYLQKCKIHPTVHGPTDVCTSATYSIQGLPAGATVTWSASPPSGFVSLSPNGYSVTVTQLSSATVTLSAEINVGCSSFTIQKTIQVGGTPGITNMNIVRSGPSCVSSNNFPLSFGLSYSGITGCNLASYGIKEVDWEIYSPYTYQAAYNQGAYRCSSNDVINPGITLGFTVPVNPFMITLRFRVKNACGTWSNWSPGYSFQINNCTSLFTVSPNPATDLITIKQNSSINFSQQSAFIVEVKLFDKIGRLRKSKKFGKEAKSGELNVSGLPTGDYYLKIITSDNTTSTESILIR